MSKKPEEPRSVITDALRTLGTIIGPDEKRDAIHLAVEPVIANMRLTPGDHIRITNGRADRVAVGKGQGIVDPFIHGTIPEGARFWFVMYPRQVTSLRHVWSHPEFPDEGSGAPESTGNRAASRAWLLEYVGRVKRYDVEGIEAFGDYKGQPAKGAEWAVNRLLLEIDAKEVFYHGTDLHSRDELIDPAELAYHAGVLLGHPVNFNDEDFLFTCSC